MKVKEAREALERGMKAVIGGEGNAGWGEPSSGIPMLLYSADAYAAARALQAHVDACVAGFIRTSSDPHDGQPKCGTGYYCGKAKDLEGAL